MASIKGFELKAVKHFEGMEGIGFNANLYFNGKRVGRASDYATGAHIEYYVEDKRIESKLEEVAKEYDDFGFEVVGTFINELLTLKMLEKEYKKAIKEGYGSIAYLTDSYNKKGPRKIPEIYSIPKGYDGDINEDGFDNVYMYTSLDDFKIV